MAFGSATSARNLSIWNNLFLRDQQADIDRRINEGRGLSLDALGKGYDAARGSYGDAIELYEPYRTTGIDAWKQYADATGVNGQEGFDRSVGLFRASPGYNNMVDEATDAVARKQSAIGALGSGNTMQAITDRASALADREYDDYLGRIKGVSDVGYAATGAQAGLTKGIGDLFAQQGAGEAGIYGDSTRLGVGAARDYTQGIIGSNNQAAQTAQDAAGQRLGLLMGGLTLGGKLLGTAAGGGFNSWFK